MKRRTRIAVWAGAALLLAWGIWLPVTAAHPPQASEIFVQVLPTASFFVCGLILLERRPGNLIGPLMLVSGAAWEIPWLGFYHTPVTFTVANLAESFYQVPLGHLAVAYPSGRIRSTYDRAVVISIYVWWVVNNLAFGLFWDPRLDGATDPWDRNVLLIHSSPGFVRVYHVVSYLVTIVLVSAVAVAIVRHWMRGTQPARRALVPMLWVLVPTAGFIILQEAAANGEITGVANDFIVRAGPVSLAALPAAMLYGLWRSRASRGAVSDLVMVLSEAPEPGRLREALARALGDPSVQIAYPRDDGVDQAGHVDYVDADGRPIAVPPEGPPGRAATVLQGAGRDLAVLIYDEALAEEPERVAGVGAALRMALENERLQAEVKAQLAEVRASRARILQAGDAERQRIERNLHDGAQQRLVTLSMALRLAEAQADASNPELGEALHAASGEVREALADLRELSSGLHPAILTRGGLAPAIRGLAERAALPVDITSVPSERLPPDVEAAVYFVVSEALANAGKYAHASGASVKIVRANGCVHVEVADDGVGGAEPAQGSGLTGLADRVAVLGGTLSTVSRAGIGTRVVADVPCES